MPYEIKKEGRCYQVINTDTQQVHAKCTSKAKAEAQVRLLESVVEHKEDKGKIQMNMKTFKKEHKELLDVLKNPTPSKLQHEYKKQAKEVKKVEGKGVKKTSSWIDFYKTHTKGKTFGSRAAVNEHMKKLSAEYKKTKK